MLLSEKDKKKSVIFQLIAIPSCRLCKQIQELLSVQRSGIFSPFMQTYLTCDPSTLTEIALPPSIQSHSYLCITTLMADRY
jgi:hypothetical protein